jgi:hypothetical protein
MQPQSKAVLACHVLSYYYKTTFLSSSTSLRYSISSRNFIQASSSPTVTGCSLLSTSLLKPSTTKSNQGRPVMRTAVILAVVPVAIASAIPASGDRFPSSFDKRDDISAITFRGKILSADLYARDAGLNQQTYQATQKGTQWKRCNPSNIVVRREWCIALDQQHSNMLTVLGLRSQPLRRITTFPQYNVSRNYHPRLPSQSARVVRIATMILLPPTSSKPSL